MAIAFDQVVADAPAKPAEDVEEGVERVSAMCMIADASAALSSLAQEEGEDDGMEARRIAAQLYMHLSKVLGPKRTAGSVVAWIDEDSQVPELISVLWERAQDAKEKLRRFGLFDFRPLQLEAVTALLRPDLKKNIYAHMPTGAGKSLIFMLAALLKAPEEVTCLIIPLKALSHQLHQLLSHAEIPVVRLLADSDTADRQELARVVACEQECRVLIFTPEKLLKNGGLRDNLRKLDEQRRLGLFVIDECHCIAESSREYRPEYSQLGTAIHDVCRVPQFCALSAVATDDVVEGVTRCLRMRPDNSWYFRGHFGISSAIQYKVVARHTPDDMSAVVNEIQHGKCAGGSAIVYCRTKQQVHLLSQSLEHAGLVVARYTAGIPDAEQRIIQAHWMATRTVVVATCAFGLGIDKPDCRQVGAPARFRLILRLLYSPLPEF